jgi:hypothetical protein
MVSWLCQHNQIEPFRQPRSQTIILSRFDFLKQMVPWVRSARP